MKTKEELEERGNGAGALTTAAAPAPAAAAADSADQGGGVVGAHLTAASFPPVPAVLRLETVLETVGGDAEESDADNNASNTAESDFLTEGGRGAGSSDGQPGRSSASRSMHLRRDSEIDISAFFGDGGTDGMQGAGGSGGLNDGAAAGEEGREAEERDAELVYDALREAFRLIQVVNAGIQVADPAAVHDGAHHAGGAAAAPAPVPVAAPPSGGFPGAAQEVAGVVGGAAAAAPAPVEDFGYDGEHEEDDMQPGIGGNDDQHGGVEVVAPAPDEALAANGGAGGGFRAAIDGFRHTLTEITQDPCAYMRAHQAEVAATVVAIVGIYLTWHISGNDDGSHL